MQRTYTIVDMLPTRRDLIDLALRAAALPGAAEFFSEWLQAADEHSHGSTAPPEPPLLRNYKPQFFGPEDFEALEAFTEILIPTDETPGAREAHCAHYIDFVLNAATPDMQRSWRSALAALRTDGFHAADAAGRAAIVEAMSKSDHFAFRLIKQQNTF